MMKADIEKRDARYFMWFALICSLFYLTSVTVVLIKMVQVTGFESIRIGFVSAISYVLPRMLLLVLFSFYLGRYSGIVFICAGLVAGFKGPWTYLIEGQFEHDPHTTVASSLYSVFSSTVIAIFMIIHGYLLVFFNAFRRLATTIIASMLGEMSKRAPLLLLGVLAYYSLLPLERFSVVHLVVPITSVATHEALRWSMLILVLLNVYFSVRVVRIVMQRHYFRSVAAYIVLLSLIGVSLALTAKEFLVFTSDEWPFVSFLVYVDYGPLSLVLSVALLLMFLRHALLVLEIRARWR